MHLMQPATDSDPRFRVGFFFLFYFTLQIRGGFLAERFRGRIFRMIEQINNFETIRGNHDFRAEKLQLRHKYAKATNHIRNFVPMRNRFAAPAAFGHIARLRLDKAIDIILDIGFFQAVRVLHRQHLERSLFVFVKDEVSVTDDGIVTKLIENDEIQYTVIGIFAEFYLFFDYQCYAVIAEDFLNSLLRAFSALQIKHTIPILQRTRVTTIGRGHRQAALFLQ